MASLLTPEFVSGDRPARRTPKARPPRSPSGTSARPRSTRRWSRRASSRRGPGSAGSSRAAQDAGWTLAVASTSAEPSVRAILDYAVGPGAGRPVRPLPRRRRAWPEEEAGPGHLPARPRAARRAGRPRCSSSRTRATACVAAARAPGCAASMTVNGYTEKEDISEAILVVSSLGDPDGERTTRDRQPLGRAAGRVRHARRPRGLPGLVAAGGTEQSTQKGGSHGTVVARRSRPRPQDDGQDDRRQRGLLRPARLDRRATATSATRCATGGRSSSATTTPSTGRARGRSSRRSASPSPARSAASAARSGARRSCAPARPPATRPS